MSYRLKYFLVGMYALIMLSGLFVFNESMSYESYTLHTNHKWESGKTKLQRGVVATWCMVFAKAGLSRNQLNIGAWQGYQELVYKQKINPKKISFDCKSRGKSFSFFTNKNEGISEGIYFNYKEDSVCCLFSIDSTGKFSSTTDFSIGKMLSNDKWNRIVVVNKHDSLILIINDKKVISWKDNNQKEENIGFRGGNQDVWIDNVKMETKKGVTVLLDDFSPPFKVHFLSIFVFLFILIVHFYNKNSPNIFLVLCSLSLGYILCYVVYFWYLSSLYPQSDNYIDFKGVNYKIESETEVCQRIAKQFDLDTSLYQKRVILMIGTSQTWGAGTSSFGKTYPEILQDSLNKHFLDSSYLVINTGIPGSESSKLLSFYKSNWLKYKPVMTIINLSTNDYDTTLFKKSIHEFLAINDSLKIKTVLIAEPNDLLHTPRLAYNHQLLKSMASKFHNVPVIELQSYMDSCHTKGFLWWDYVHPTDYGYELLAGYIFPILKGELECKKK